MDAPKPNEGEKPADPMPRTGKAEEWPDGPTPDPPPQELVPGKYGTLTILPGVEFTLTPEQLTWPVVDYSVHPPRVKSPGQPKPPATSPASS